MFIDGKPMFIDDLPTEKPMILMVAPGEITMFGGPFFGI